MFVKQISKKIFVYFPFSPLPTQLRVYSCTILKIPCPQKMKVMRSLMMDLILRKKREILDIREREKEINRQRRVKER